jgi:hypothetical protein
MNNYDAREALSHMYGAQEILFSQLRNPATLSRDVAEGLDSLFRAIEFAENPGVRILTCPECASTCLDEIENGGRTCLSCDLTWDPSKAEGAFL